MTTDSKFTLIEGSGDWSALYVDGKLHTVGDHYVVHEALFGFIGVNILDESEYDFTLGNRFARKDDIAPTLADIEVYETEKLNRRTQAIELRAQAEKLILQAKALEQSEYS